MLQCVQESFLIQQSKQKHVFFNLALGQQWLQNQCYLIEMTMYVSIIQKHVCLIWISPIFI